MMRRHLGGADWFVVAMQLPERPAELERQAELLRKLGDLFGERKEGR